MAWRLQLTITSNETGEVRFSDQLLGNNEFFENEQLKYLEEYDIKLDLDENYCFFDYELTYDQLGLILLALIGYRIMCLERRVQTDEMVFNDSDETIEIDETISVKEKLKQIRQRSVFQAKNLAGHVAWTYGLDIFQLAGF